MSRQEVLDEEKRARVEEMSKTGLPIKRGNNIPFGVRAIQSGIEVDGIWISRPESLSDAPGAKLASSTTLTGRDSYSQMRGRDNSGDERSVVVATTNQEYERSQYYAQIFQKPTDSQSSTTRLPSLFAHTTKRQTSQPSGALNEDTPRRLNCQSPAIPLYETYMPTTSPRANSHSAAGSSSAESVNVQPGSTSDGPSSHGNSRIYTTRDPDSHRSQTEGSEQSETPPVVRGPSGFSQVEVYGALQQGESQEINASKGAFQLGKLSFEVGK